MMVENEETWSNTLWLWMPRQLFVLLTHCVPKGPPEELFQERLLH